MMKRFKAFGQEFKNDAGNNCVSTINKDENKKGYTKIYIGNVSSEASIEKIQKFLGDIKIDTFKQQNKKNYFALANLPNRLEAEKTVKMYDNKIFMGQKLVVRLDDKQIVSSDTNNKILPEMPKLEDIDDDDDDNDSNTLQCDILNHQSSNNKPNFNCTNSQKCCEYLINLQPDSDGLFSLFINRKDSSFTSKKEVKDKLSQFGSVSDVYFSSDSAIVKIPSMKHVLNIFKALNEELNMFIGDNSLKRNPENSHAKIYIGNIAVKVSRAQILNFFGDIKFTSFQLVNGKKRSYALANLSNRLEAEKTIEIYNNKVFMGKKLVVRVNNQDKNAKILSEMPKLEDIDDDDEDSASKDNLSNKSYNSKMNSAMPKLDDIEAKKKDFCTNIKTCSEDSLNIQPDSSGLFSLIINKKDAYLRSENVIKNIFLPYGSVSSVSFIDDKIVVKMPSKMQAINSFKSLSQDLNMSIENNTIDTTTVKKNQNKSLYAFSDYVKIYIGNIAMKASQTQILKFFGDVNLTSFQLITQKNKVFALAYLPNILEAEKTVEMYNNKFFMGHKLILRVDDKHTSNTLSQSNKSTSKRSVNDWSSLSNDNDHSTDFKNHVTLFIANFPVGMSKKQLLSLFQDFHPSSVFIINNHNKKRSIQALMKFPNQKESEKAIYKFDKLSCEKNTLLVTSVGFCPCLDNEKHKRKYTVPTHNPSNSQKEKLEHLKCPPSARHNHHQQQEINCQLTNSFTHGIANQETLIKSPTNNSTNKHLDENKQQMKEENQLIKVSQFDDPFQIEAAKMAVLIKYFQIQPCLNSSSDTLQVMITSVINNELFWGTIFYSLSNEMTDFMAVHNELQSNALSWPDYILSKKEMKCVALYQDEWYRAWVLNTVKNNAVKVFFLDYGNTSEIDLKYVKSPNESIWKLPPKARAFRIDSNSKRLTANAENQIFNIKICKSGNIANGFISVASLTN